MKATIKVEKEVNIVRMEVAANVRYWEDSEINGVSDEDGSLTPCRDGDLWKPIIEFDTGKILNWEQGKKASIHFKVCDQCSYTLIDETNNIAYEEEDEYVPDLLCPEEDGYGDYIIMEIDENGMIQNWTPDLSFLNEDE